MFANNKYVSANMLKHKCRKDYGRELSHTEILELGKNVMAAFYAATIVGLSKRSSPLWKETWEFFSPLLKANQQLVSIDWHYENKDKLANKYLGKRIFYVGGRDLKDYFQKNFSPKSYHQMLLVPEHRFTQGIKSRVSTIDILPQTMYQIEKMDFTGKTCFLAVGVAGKILGKMMYERGGDVMDIGSTADYWLGIKSREWIRNA